MIPVSAPTHSVILVFVPALHVSTAPVCWSASVVPIGVCCCYVDGCCFLCCLFLVVGSTCVPKFTVPLWWYLQLILWSLLCFSFHSILSWSIILSALVMLSHAFVVFSCFPVIIMVALFSSSWNPILMLTCFFFQHFSPIMCPMRSPLVVITSMWSSFSVFSSLSVVSWDVLSVLLFSVVSISCPCRFSMMALTIKQLQVKIFSSFFCILVLSVVNAFPVLWFSCCASLFI